MRSSDVAASRREVLAALSTLVLSCEQKRPPAPAVAAVSAPGALVQPAVSSAAVELLPASEVTWRFSETPIGKMCVVVSLPERRAGERFPVLIALHGRGETLKGPERGARGWVDDYALTKAVERLRKPPLVARDFEGFVEAERLRALNGALGAVPYGGLVVACPYLPDILRGEEPFTSAPPLTRFLVETLLPKLYAETPAIGSAHATGIDGVSLGGRGAIAVGLARPDAFGSVGSLQAALDSKNAGEVVARARRALEKNPKLRLRLVTSSEDYYLPALRTIASALRHAGVPHDFVVTRGPHDYAWNRGPGAYEMLLFHDRVLRGHEPV